MKLTKKTIELVCELEKIIGNQCYNPNSYDGYTMEYGKYFRYPIHFIDKDKNLRKTNFKVEDINKDGVFSMHYSFGSNELYIGSAIVYLLGHLEEKFNIDFNQLSK